MEQEAAMPGTARIEAFSDGVLAIVITLLVLELRVPHLAGEPSAQELLAAFSEIRAKFASFVVSFIIIAIFWINHHQLFSSIRRANRGLLWLNMLFLLFISAVPFPTAVIGEYPGNSFAVAFFGMVMAGAGLSFAWMRWYAAFPGRLIAADDASLRRGVRRSLLSPGLYGIGALLAFASPPAAIIVYILVPLIYVVPSAPPRRPAERGGG